MQILSSKTRFIKSSYIVIMLFLIFIPSYSFATNAVKLNDLQLVSSYAKESVTNLSEKNIITGDEHGNFNPNQNITRAQMVTIIIKSMEIHEVKLPDKPTFNDVPITHWAYEYIETAYQKGIIKGIAPGVFDAEGKCTREQMTTILVNALDLPEGEIEKMMSYQNSFEERYKDKSNISSWAYNKMKFAVQHNLLYGINENILGPKNYATKEQMAVVLVRFLKEKTNIRKLVEESNTEPYIYTRQPLIEILDVTPTDVEIHPDTNPQVTIKYKLNRPANFYVQIIRIPGISVSLKEIQHTMPGIYEFKWNLKNEDGVFVENGHYEILFMDKIINYPWSISRFRAEAKIMIPVKKIAASDERILEILPEVKFEKDTFTPNNDNINDTINGSITLGEEANINVWISNETGSHVSHAMPLAKKSDNRKPGTYTFSWDGKRFKEFEDIEAETVPNGKYYLNMIIADKNGTVHFLRKFRGINVEVKGSFDVAAAEPIRRVRVVKNGVNFKPSPDVQNYIAKKGDVFPITRYGSTATYCVLLPEGVEGRIEMPDVELMDLDTIPEKWAQASNDGVEFYFDYRKTKTLNDSDHYEMDKILYKDTQVQILYEFDKWYHVALESGEQGFVYKKDFNIIKSYSSF